jgi:hypothetical protein
MGNQQQPAAASNAVLPMVARTVTGPAASASIEDALALPNSVPWDGAERRSLTQHGQPVRTARITQHYIHMGFDITSVEIGPLTLAFEDRWSATGNPEQKQFRVTMGGERLTYDAAMAQLTRIAHTEQISTERLVAALPEVLRPTPAMDVDSAAPSFN